MDHTSSWEANSSSANRKKYRFLCNRKVYCRANNSPQVAPIHSHMNPVHAFGRHYFKIHFNITLTLTPRSP